MRFKGVMVCALLCSLVLVLSAAAAENGKIAFASGRDENNEIYVMNPDGSDPTRLTNNGATDSDPAWSPDGTEIAFVSDRDGNPEIYVMDSDGSSPKRLTDNGLYDYDYSPAFSPDGMQIVFVSTRDGNYEIYLMDADGTDPTRLTNNEAGDYHPAWSPDGTKIAFESNRDGNSEIYVMDTEGGTVARLTDNEGYDSGPAWSPDGTKIAFEASQDGNSEIYVMDQNGGNLVRLTNSENRDYSPAWSPDGTQIAYTSFSFNDYTANIFVIDANGGIPVQITDAPGGNGDPAWWGQISETTGSVGFSTTVLGGQNTVIQSSDGAFGPLRQGGSATLTSAVVLSNTGGSPARVEARFEMAVGGIFGLISDSNVLPASNFGLGPTGSLVALSNAGTDVQVAIAPVGITNLDAKLSVPSTQAPGSYYGNVILTFSNA